MRHIHQKAVNQRVHSVDITRRDEMRRHHNKVLLLSGVCRSEAQIRTETTDPDSLHATSTRQNIRQSLVHITDTAHTFTQHLTEHVLTLQNSDTIVAKGENTHQFVLDTLTTNDALRVEFQDMFVGGEHYTESLQPCDIVELNELFEEIVSLFSRVMLKQLRKDFLAEVMRQKKQAHRKAIMAGQGRAAARRLQFSDLSNDNSATQKHKLLQTCAKTKQGLMHFTKVELLTLCRVYAISCTARQNKNTLADQLCSEVPNRRGMTNPELLACSLPSGPPVKRPRRDDVDKCRECRQGEVDESSEWIECGRCSRWLHRECAEIWEENEWQSYKETNATFICHYC